MAPAIPIDPEERERWRRDPESYEAVERLHTAGEALIAAVDHQVNSTGALFAVMHEPERSYFVEKGKVLPTPEQLRAAREDVERAQARWADAVARADELLLEHRNGGE